MTSLGCNLLYHVLPRCILKTVHDLVNPHLPLHIPRAVLQNKTGDNMHSKDLKIGNGAQNWEVYPWKSFKAPKPSQTADWISSNTTFSCTPPSLTLIRRRSPMKRQLIRSKIQSRVLSSSVLLRNLCAIPKAPASPAGLLSCCLILWALMGYCVQ